MSAPTTSDRLAGSKYGFHPIVPIPGGDYCMFSDCGHLTHRQQRQGQIVEIVKRENTELLAMRKSISSCTGGGRL